MFLELTFYNYLLTFKWVLRIKYKSKKYKKIDIIMGNGLIIKVGIR